MHLALERGVPREERQKAALGTLTDWDAARVFLEVVRCGSFRSAAERLELSINVVRRRIDDFERQIGASLFTRNYWAIANGAGIGVLPTYSCALGGKIIPPEVELRRPYHIWLSYHPGCGRIPRVRHMIDWLVEAFNPVKFPWFKNEFIHPSEFKSVYKGETLTHLFGGFSTEGR